MSSQNGSILAKPPNQTAVVPHSELETAADELMAAAEKYFFLYHKAGLPGGKNIIYVAHRDGRTVLFTPGPFQSELIRFVDTIGKR